MIRDILQAVRRAGRVPTRTCANPISDVVKPVLKLLTGNGAGARPILLAGDQLPKRVVLESPARTIGKLRNNPEDYARFRLPPTRPNLSRKLLGRPTWGEVATTVAHTARKEPADTNSQTPDRLKKPSANPAKKQRVARVSTSDAKQVRTLEVALSFEESFPFMAHFIGRSLPNHRKTSPQTLRGRVECSSLLSL